MRIKYFSTLYTGKIMLTLNKFIKTTLVRLFCPFKCQKQEYSNSLLQRFQGKRGIRDYFLGEKSLKKKLHYFADNKKVQFFFAPVQQIRGRLTVE